ncbi:hypothetical protein AALB_3375 [Agarivorans albus MKT 106]|uniref:Uncharacterized protein n=1 Tax=Agarivorans albus MKT 106 TaxID=1331007 RepID=R9PPQ8_AGAAL|nr:hypothetical protein AALB_3375 [Agarivorans albus MKT 106]
MAAIKYYQVNHFIRLSTEQLIKGTKIGIPNFEHIAFR